MTNKLLTYGGTNWVDGDVLNATDLVEGMERVGTGFRTTYWPGAAASRGILIFSTSVWLVSGARITADGGGSWAAKGNAWVLGEVSRETSTRAVVSSSGGVIQFTTDSGTTLSAPTTAPAFITACVGVSYVSDDLCVIVGTASSGAGAWFSTDGGDNWTQATTGPTTVTGHVDMFDDSTGYLIDTTQSVFKTTDGGVNWTDTTHNVAPDNTLALRCLTATEVILTYHTTSLVIAIYDNDDGSVTTKYSLIGTEGGGNSGPSAIFVSAAGNHYIAIVYDSEGDATTGVAEVILLKSTDNAENWEFMGLPSDMKKGTQGQAIPMVAELSTGIFLFAQNNVVFKVFGVE